MANANGASGTPTWNIDTLPSGGNVTLSCYLCTNPVATSTAPSSSCSADITVWLTYPDGSQSADFYVTIVKPNSLSLEPGYPRNQIHDGLNGYESDWDWYLYDDCGSQDPGLDANETFGTWTDVWVGNTLGLPHRGVR